MRREKVIVIGHSHAQSVEHAQARRKHNEEHTFDLVPLQLARPGIPYVLHIDGRWQYNPELYVEIGALFETHQPALTVLMLEGGECSRSGFQWPAVPFDFCLPGETFVPTPGLGDIVPWSLVRDWAHTKHYQLSREFLSRLNPMRQGPWIAVAPPPLVGDDAFLTRMLQKHELIRDEIRACGLPPAAWRRKMRTVLVEAMRDMYESSGAPFLDAPDGTVDSDGFLVPAFYSDALHANSRYGELVLRQIDAALARVTEGETV